MPDCKCDEVHDHLCEHKQPVGSPRGEHTKEWCPTCEVECWRGVDFALGFCDCCKLAWATEWAQSLGYILTREESK